jgi:4-diphosphocytidyl-2-C-methyl-D-erythritol kinase
VSPPDSGGQTPLSVLAPGKVNLSLFVGAPRADGLHPLVSVVQAVTLADELTMEPAGGDADEVICPGVEGENLAARALARFREATGWDGPPQRLTIAKRIPVAAGMGGGSSDAAATLRLAAHAAGGADPSLLHELAAGLGGDVPSLLNPGRVLMTGAGERVARLPEPEPFGLVILPSHEMLSTPAVYREFDRRTPARSRDELLALELEAHGGLLPPPVNDLQDAARALSATIDPLMEAVGRSGAEYTRVSGSGPTVFGVFADVERARAAAAAIPGAIAVEPVPAGYGEVRTV